MVAGGGVGGVGGWRDRAKTQKGLMDTDNSVVMCGGKGVGGSRRWYKGDK